MSDIPKDQITAVIPAFNEVKTISRVVQGASKYVREVIVVDDGSEDGTAEAAVQAGARPIRLPRNSGKGIALSIGLTTAALNGGEIVVCLDADGQHDPEDIPRIVGPIVEGRADMVIGSRFLEAHAKETIPTYRRLGQGVLTIATNLGNPVKISDSQSGFRAFRKAAVNTFNYSTAGMGIESEMVRNAVRSGLRIEEVPIVATYKGLDTSTLSPGSHGMRVLGAILGEIRSGRPLLYFGLSGMIMTVMGVIFGLYSIEQYILVKALPFGPSLLAVLLTVLGVLFILVGIILSAINEMVNGNRIKKHNGA